MLVKAYDVQIYLGTILRANRDKRR